MDTIGEITGGLSIATGALVLIRWAYGLARGEGVTSFKFTAVSDSVKVLQDAFAKLQDAVNKREYLSEVAEAEKRNMQARIDRLELQVDRLRDRKE